MPIGIQRLNAKRSQPNPSIVFIKPLKGPDEKVAQDFLERIAAQCLPVMREHGLSVMTLEEFEPNREFVGRNFNAGEVVQLVLKAPGSGRWLPFDYVQMVMMHELAHCKQMNHSRAFWAVRNQYAAQMHGLWARGYTGDGIWGRGASLRTGLWERDTVRAGEALPEHLCGGTYRSRRRKRKARPALSYKERKERRIAKKFGGNGVALGADDEVKAKLEKGKKVKSKPRVAGSARGRELRAAAALARFEKQKDEEEEVDLKAETETESGSESDFEDEDADSKDAVDVDGTRLTDEKGKGMVRVCEDEDTDDPGARNELDELQHMFRSRGIKKESPEPSLSNVRQAENTKVGQQGLDAGQPSGSVIKAEPGEDDLPNINRLPKMDAVVSTQRGEDQSSRPDTKRGTAPAQATQRTPTIKEQGNAGETTCLVCSFANPRTAVTCAMCANVLDPADSPDAWRCDGEPCRDSAYRNSGDCGICGLCGRRRGGPG